MIIRINGVDAVGDKLCTTRETFEFFAADGHTRPARIKPRYPEQTPSCPAAVRLVLSSLCMHLNAAALIVHVFALNLHYASVEMTL